MVEFSIFQTCLFKVLEEEEVLTYFEQLSEIDDTALKVFRRDDRPQDDDDDDVPPLKSYVSSCHALKQAVTTLYNMGDFELKKIGEGFFSEVFKVSLIIVYSRDRARGNDWQLILTYIGDAQSQWLHQSFETQQTSSQSQCHVEGSSIVEEFESLQCPTVRLQHCQHLIDLSFSIYFFHFLTRYEGAVVHEGQLHALTEVIFIDSFTSAANDSLMFPVHQWRKPRSIDNERFA